MWDISEVKETRGSVQAASWLVAVGLCGAAGWEGPCAGADFAIHPSLKAVPVGSYSVFGCLRSKVWWFGSRDRGVVGVSLTEVMAHYQSRGRSGLQPFTKSAVQRCLSESLTNRCHFLRMEIRNGSFLQGKKMN